MVKVLIILLILFVAIVVISIVIGRISWDKYTSLLTQKLNANNKGTVERVNFEDLSGLPNQVQKYFKLVLEDGAPIINRASITQHGGFRVKPGSVEWLEMNTTQIFTTDSRGFVWNATIEMVPLVNIRVIDSYITGKGAMKGKILSLITIINENDKTELNKAALQRYLAESVWFPTALLPSQGVKWTEIDGKKAMATINDSGITVSLDFEFNEMGEIIGVYTKERYREVNGKYELFPWRGKFSTYIDIQGYRIPSVGEVTWILEEGTFPYWRADLTKVEYD